MGFLEKSLCGLAGGDASLDGRATDRMEMIAK
jgi:hypothetical protein